MQQLSLASDSSIRLYISIDAIFKFLNTPSSNPFKPNYESSSKESISFLTFPSAIAAFASRTAAMTYSRKDEAELLEIAELIRTTPALRKVFACSLATRNLEDPGFSILAV